MERIETADIEPDIPAQRLRSTLDDAPVRLAILFGSRVTGRIHTQSDIDLAVEFADIEPGDPAYNETFFGLTAALSDALGTDDIDLVDIRSLSPSLARSVFDDGILVLGTVDRAETLSASILSDEPDERSPGDRFDDALRRIDEHLA